MIIDERLRHYVNGGRQVERVTHTQTVCWPCWYGECDQCLKGRETEKYRHECECVHWWSALGVGDSYEQIQSEEKAAREAAANAIRYKSNGVRAYSKR